MQESLKSLLKKAIYLPKASLAADIWQVLMLRNQRIVYFKLTILSLIGGSSFLGLVLAFKTLALDFSQSGFYEYFSLIFSSGWSIVSYWRELALSLAESLPVISIILSLTLALVLFLSLKNAMKQITRNYKSQLLAV